MVCAVFCKSLGNCFQLCLEGVQKSLWEKTCCPFPSTMYAELRTQTEAIWFECHRNVCQHTTSYLNHHHLQGRLSIWLCFDWRRRLGKLRHVLRRNHSDETRETARPRTEPSSPEPPQSISGAKRFHIFLFICVQSKPCLKNPPSLSVQTPVLLTHWMSVSCISPAHSIPVVSHNRQQPTHECRQI